MLGLRDASRLMARYDLPPLYGNLLRTPKDVAHEVERLAVPVALKAISRTLTHKSASGLLELDVVGAARAEIVAEAMVAKTEDDDGFEGILVQRMVRGGIELFLGALIDERFGPVVAFGPGGTLVEYLGGVDFIRPPVTERELGMFVERNVVCPLLLRSGSGGPEEASKRVAILTGLLGRIATMISELRDRITSIDINPLSLSPATSEPIVIDLRVEGRIENGGH